MSEHSTFQLIVVLLAALRIVALCVVEVLVLTYRCSVFTLCCASHLVCLHVWLEEKGSGVLQTDPAVL